VSGAHDLESLLEEQLAYYRARAPEYTETAFPELSSETLRVAEREFARVLDDFDPAGDVLELACGPGTWTARLLDHASALIAVDGSPEMLRLAAARIQDPRVRFVQADLFQWRPDRRYDVVFFGFWLSHVPIERFERFWSLVAECLKPDGRVLFVDDAFRTPDELIEGERSSVIRRRLTDGTAFRAVKVPHTPGALERRLTELGWRIRVTSARAGPFFWGAGTRLAAAPWREAWPTGRSRLPPDTIRPMITKLDFVAVPSRDAKRAHSFYVDTLGLRPDEHGQFECWAGKTCLGIWEPERFGATFAPQKNGHLALHVEDVDKARAELETKGVEFAGETLDTGVCRMAFFTDLDGNDLMLHSRYAPPGQRPE
jgi:demethylmenaquinone methyltransferase/2-methoxy-6-polyprenyl-1,4-benzoquinol methylase